MPDYNKFKKIMALMQEYASDFEKDESPKEESEEAENDGGQSDLTDMGPELDSSDEVKGSDSRKKAKIAMYGTMLKKKLGY